MDWGLPTEEEEKKVLVVKDESEFRRRLKKSFSGAELVEQRPPTFGECLICCQDLTAGYGTIAHPCSGAKCSCGEGTANCCQDCLMQLLWKSPRSQVRRSETVRQLACVSLTCVVSQKQLGRFRANCAFCKAEFCHYDVGAVVFAGSGGPAKGSNHVSRLALARVCGAREREALLEFGKEAVLRAGPLERLVREFALSGEEQREASLNSEERKEVHRIAEALGLGHDSSGQGEQRVMVLSKPTGWGLSDSMVFQGYVGLIGDSVDCAAAVFAAKVPEPARAKRAERDGVTHHITMASRKEVAELAKKAGEKKVTREVASDTLRSMEEDGLANDWVAAGLGSVTVADNQCWFVVVDWPAANKWRQKMGLTPATFHITLGFVVSDVHVVPKDAATIIEKSAPQ